MSNHTVCDQTFQKQSIKNRHFVYGTEMYRQRCGLKAATSQPLGPGRLAFGSGRGVRQIFWTATLMSDRISCGCARCYVLLSSVDMTVIEQRTFVRFAFKRVGVETSTFRGCHSPEEWKP